MLAAAFEHLDAAAEVLLQKTEPLAEIAPRLVRKGAELLASFFRDEEFVAHER